MGEGPSRSPLTAYRSPTRAVAFASIPASSCRYDAANFATPSSSRYRVTSARSIPVRGQRVEQPRRRGHRLRDARLRLAMISVGREGVGRQGVHRVARPPAPRRNRRRGSGVLGAGGGPERPLRLGPGRRERPPAGCGQRPLERGVGRPRVGDRDGPAQAVRRPPPCRGSDRSARPPGSRRTTPPKRSGLPAVPPPARSRPVRNASITAGSVPPRTAA